MQFATLEEAYPMPVKKQSLKKKEACEKFGTDYGTESDCYYDKQGLKMPSCDRFTNPPPPPINTTPPAITPSTTNPTTTAPLELNNKDVNYLRNEYVKKMCSPLQVPNYDVPVDSKSQKAFKKAMETSLMDAGQVQIDKFSIKPYDFDEYDAYLNINNINTNSKDFTNEYKTTPFLEEYLKSLRTNFNKKENIRINDIEQFTNYSKNLKVDINLYNLFLFIFIGIILILLCDQITKLSIVIANKNI
jgi:hypothetical protein